jgi:prepilin-type N-terminal cleavage/methylation domain-containing protein
MKRSRAGVTLMELLVAVTLFSLLSMGMLYAFRIGLTAYAKTQSKLMDNRRVAGAQRVLLQQLQNMVPVVAPCEGGPKVPFFQGQQESMRLVSTFSLQGASRGVAQILEIFVGPGGDGRGVRLLVNEIPYAGPRAVGRLCTAQGGYAAISASDRTFVLADKLAFVRFTYLKVPLEPDPERVWVPQFLGIVGGNWPRAVRIEMAPYEVDPSKLQPIGVTAVLRVHRGPDIEYGDF